MNTLELKQELQEFISLSDDKSLEKFYEMAKTYLVKFRKDKMIAESEEDIKNKKIHSQEDVIQIIQNWKE